MEKGKKIIIATHGYLADGFVSALNIIVGDMKDLKAMCCYTSPDFNLDNQITQMMENHDFEKEDLVICTDILGGSVNNGFVKFLGTYPFHLITNINLAFLIDLLLTTPTVSDNTLEMKTKEELFGVKYINKSIAFIPGEDDL